ncbi:restriction endonuclease subunit S [Psychrobacter aquimaris]|uniref:restriction endonuclease subunit S n=1 Tax=Psychrobacter aquimaris TaxID=292733 RepID=UPI003FD64097
MAKYQRYEEYREVDVEWADAIPVHWKTASLSKLFMIKAGGDLQVNLFSDIKSEECQYPIYTNANDSKAIYGYTKKPNFPANAITVSGRGEVGFAVYRNHEFDAIIRLLVLIPLVNCDGRYFSHFINEVIDFNVQSSAIGQLSTLQISPYKVAIPPYQEQSLISDYLDHETAQIDTLIEKQQTLIQLLKEKRQAVISHAVTKGLNPDAPMKDSGVEWLGEVPEHWEVQRFKFMCDQIISGPFGSSITKDMYVKYGYKVYGQEQVIANDFEIGDYFISAKDFENLSRYKVKKGSILISCVGTFGKIAVFPFDAPEGIINPRLIQAKLNSGNDSFFIRELLKSETVYKQFELLSRGGTMGVINISILNEIIVAAPNKSEQTEVYEYLVEQQNRFNGLIEKAEQAIKLMQERRTALISAAVTGKIDVRGWRASE